MICKLNELIWFGDKASVKEGMDHVGSVINAASTIRRPYWDWVGKLDWKVWYFHMGCPDRIPVDWTYVELLKAVVYLIRQGRKFPLLCHCKAGGHRGPTAAVFAYWCIHDQTEKALDEAIRLVEKHKPNYNRPSNLMVYRNSMLDYCRRYSYVTT